MKNNLLVAGVDEVGRGPLAGAVVAAVTATSADSDGGVVRSPATSVASVRPGCVAEVVCEACIPRATC